MQFNKVNIPKLARNRYDYVAQGSGGGTTIISGGSGGNDSISRLIEPIYSDEGEICGIRALYSVAVQGGITTYREGEGLNLPSIYDGMPIDNITLYWDNGVLKSKGTDGMDEGKLKTYLDTNAYINNANKSNYLPSWALATNKPSYAWSEIGNKPTTLDGYGITDVVTLNTAQAITGAKDFTGGLSVNGCAITYDTATKGWKLTGNLLVTGGITAYGDILTGSVILDTLPVDSTLSKEGGVLSVVGGHFLSSITVKLGTVAYDSASGIVSLPVYPTTLPASDVSAWAKAAGKPAYTWSEVNNKPAWIGSDKPAYAWTEIGSKPTWIGANKPSYVWSEIGGKPSWIGDNKPSYAFSEIGGKPTTLSGYGITDAVTLNTAQTITAAKNFTGGFAVNGCAIVYDAVNKAWKLTGNLLVTGGITAYGDILTGSVILDALPVDSTLSKEGGVLSVVGGGFLSSITVKLGAVAYDSANGVVSLPAYPTTLPASDVSAWAKAASKPAYIWAEIGGKPSTFAPSAHSHAISEITNLQGLLDGKAANSHTHNYASTVKVGATGYSVTGNVISLPEYPTALKSPNALTISLNGASQGAYDGSAAKSFNINYSNIGAPSTTGANASGTWGINITGDANTLDGYHAAGLYTVNTYSGGRLTNTIGTTSRYVDLYNAHHNAGAQGGTNGCLKVATITIGGAYQNHPISFKINQRGRKGANLTILFNNSGTAGGTTLNSFFYTGELTTAYLVNSITGTVWDLYIQKEEAYGSIAISLQSKGSYMGSTSITWKDEFVSSISGGATATYWNPTSHLFAGRSINGTNFDGTGNIVTSYWGTSRNFSIVSSNGSGASSAVSVNGSGNVSLYLPSTITASLSGNATTATTLQTARTLWGQRFNGDGNVSGTLTGVTGITMSGTLNNSGKSLLGVSYSQANVNAGPNFHVSTGDATLAIYGAVGQNSSYGAETACIQSSFDTQNPESSGYPSSMPTRAVLALQPRGGRVSVGKTTADATLDVKGNVATEGGSFGYSCPNLFNPLWASFSVQNNVISYVGHLRNIVCWRDIIGGVGYITSYTIGSYRDNNGWGKMLLAVSNSDSGSSIGSSIAINGNGIVTVEGNLLVTGGITQYQASDRTLKRNIHLVTDASKRLMSIGGIYDFEYTDEEVRRNSACAGKHTGLIYQNVKNTEMGRMCHERKDGKGSVNYIDTGFISLLAAVGMEHETRLQRLERENKELRQEINKLKEREA